MSNPTHEVLDLTYTEEEGQECFSGTLEECNDFISKQSDYFMYRAVPIISKEPLKPIENV